MSVGEVGRLPGLTGIRGIASVWVLLFHVQAFAGLLGLCGLVGLPIMKDGFRGVDLFFILSGFILMHVHGRDFARSPRSSLGRFAVLRAARVYPLNLAALVLIATLALPLPGYVSWYRHSAADLANSYSLAGFAQTALLANRWIVPDLGEWNAPVWSLSCEVLAYTTFPLLAWAAQRPRSSWMLAGATGGLLFALVGFSALSHTAEINLTGRQALIRTFTCFPAGIALYAFTASATGQRLGERWGAAIALASALLLAATLLVPHMAILCPLCFAGMIFGVRFRRGVVHVLLSTPLALLLGRISFSLYIVHFTPLTALAWAVSTGRLPATGQLAWVWLAAYAAAVLAVTLALYYGVEIPIQRLTRRQVDHAYNANHVHESRPAG